MASGKKGKKTKGKTLALTDFLQETIGTIPAQPIRKSNINWAEEVEDYDGYDSRKPINVVLPTAPKASRDFEDFSDKVPKEPPYRAYLSNLPYDVDEEEIMLFFKNMRIANMRIPKDDRDNTKLKGFGYVEFEDRDSLLNALAVPDTTIKNRRIRIEVSANTDDRRRGRMDMGRDRMDRGEFTGDWRSGPRVEASNDDRRGGFNSGFNRDNMRGEREERSFSRDNMRGEREERSFSRDIMRGDREERSFTRDNMRGSDRDDRGYRDNTRDRDGGFGRDRDNRDGFRRDRDGSDDKQGGWREGERFNKDQDRGFSRDRGNFRDSDRVNRYDDRDDRKGFGNRRFDSDRDRNDRGGDRFQETARSEPRERPKLVLAPRTKPVENVPVKAESVPSASIFGSAKPVDTSQREREIEERLAKEHSNKSRDASKERSSHVEDSEKKIIERSRPPRKIEDSPKRDNDEKKTPRTEFKSPDKNDNRNKIDKPKREEKKEKHEKEMSKFSEPEPPNFAASNKFAFLETEDISD
ncbi:eukaryotic translation initiation factor 4B [Anoplophora glabripennis]|uniref:eukaryotic translation initiation factor 4B n=1 Tax=Anoplophora glabripennis TaxID=217634 RepID=UPI00087559B3|nr:eukaryotic translation initiation factor 4B [Anoplophora glabripennis]